MSDIMNIGRLLLSPERTAQGLLDKNDKIQRALDLAIRYGGNDGAHHKDWVIDQMVRILAGDRYEQLVADARAGEDGPDTYSWEVGIAP